jgi:uncharacterized SAM-binding protein YcdF (DUF218 family)
MVLMAVLAYLAWNVRQFSQEWETYSKEAALGALPAWASSPKEAIIVLTGARGRIPRAVQLLRTRDDGVLLITGAGKGITKKELLNQQGDAAARATEIWERIEVEDLATSTIENANESAKFLREKKIEKVILVTSDYHMPRALAIFQRVFPSVQYFPYAVSPPAGDGKTVVTRLVETYAKPTIEFFKWFLFRHYFIHTL